MLEYNLLLRLIQFAYFFKNQIVWLQNNYKTQIDEYNISLSWIICFNRYFSTVDWGRDIHTDTVRPVNYLIT